MESTVGKVISCRAAVAWEEKKPLVIETVQVDPPKEGEVRIRIHSTGVCHSDASFINGVFKEDHFPAIPGHEGAGIVESVGDGVASVSPGDHVVLTYMLRCDKCSFCKSGKTNFCQENGLGTTSYAFFMPDGSSRFHCRGKDLYHFMWLSTFSEYTVVPETTVAKISPKAPLDKVALLGCGITTGYGSVVNTAKVHKGSSVAVWGLGGVGLAAIMGAKSVGASRIIGIDINESRFENAKSFGATECVNPKDHGSNFVPWLTAHTDGGLDYTFECIGNMTTMEQAFDACHIGWGVCVVIGVSSPDAKVSANPFNFVAGKTWTGAAFGDVKGRAELPAIVDKYLAGIIKVDEFISHNFELNDINEAFDKLHKGDGIRSMVHLYKN